MHSSSGPNPSPAASEALGVDSARKRLTALINAAESGEETTIRFDGHSAKIVPIAPGTNLDNLPRFGVRDAREKLSSLVTQAAGSPSVITRNGKPVALLVSAHAPARPASSRTLTTIGDNAAALLDRQEDRRARIGIPGVDRASAVLRPGRLTLAAGAPGAGTSLLVLSAAASAALDEGAMVLYAASGPTKNDILFRLTAARADVDYQRLRAGTLTTEEQARVRDFTPNLQAANLLIDAGSDLDAAAIADVLDTAGVDFHLVVVDRLQTDPHPDRPLSGTNVPQAVKDLAFIAQRHQIPVLAALDSPDHGTALALGPDLFLALTRTGSEVQLRILEADLGVEAEVPLLLDGSRARLLDRPNTDPITEPSRLSAAPAPAEPAVVASDTSPGTAAEAAPAPAPGSVPDGPPAMMPTAAPVEGQVVRTGATKLSTGRGKDAIVAHLLTMIEDRRTSALELAQGDIQLAIRMLQKTAIPDIMAMLAYTREDARYEHTAHPPLLEIFRPQGQGSKKADAIWEGRPNWENKDLKYGLGARQLVSRLDMNAAYLAAFKAHLPIGQLKHHVGSDWDPRFAGVVRATVAPWEHRHLPDPLGSRDERDSVWITTATLSLLRRVAKEGLIQLPSVHEAWVAHSSEHMLEYLRVALATARQAGIDEGDDVVVEYVKDMYAKFVSTSGTSTNNHLLNNPSWQHILRSQAFFNLYLKALKARKAGLQLVAMKGTDELHVIGDWREVFEEGRGLTQVKEKKEENYWIPQEMPKRKGRR
ncbi:DnaB-like helicase C-terminal domain-containing protein [Kitasatospora sp. NPDC092948]|uniref:DnaB-like helicase C-terminal domain-containing protein n=1 Tax=Kitasatospora sp. NPDC092948 TaxID=3364088 RepID=UPI0037F54539